MYYNTFRYLDPVRYNLDILYALSSVRGRGSRKVRIQSILPMFYNNGNGGKIKNL